MTKENRTEETPTQNNNPKGRTQKGSSKKTNNSKNNRRNNKRKEVRSDSRAAMGSLDNTGRDNDPNWYFLDANVADQAATFAFDQYLGMDNAFHAIMPSGYNLPLTNRVVKQTVPTIMTMQCNPSAGMTADRVAGINVAALKTYTTLSARNAKTTNYAPQDISSLILAFGEVLSIEEHIRRAFGVAFTYNQRNRALPTKLLTAMGFDPEDFLTNMADHRLEFNSVITAINKIPFPTNIAYVFKCMDMYQNVYLDSESPMAQVIFARPYSTWRLDETVSDQGSVLKTVMLPNMNPTGTLDNGSFEQWMLTLKGMVSALLESSTLNYIYSDILMLHDKYSLPLATLDIVNADYSVIPEYNRNFALQFHNSNAVGVPALADRVKDKAVTNENDVMPDANFNKLDYRPHFYLPANAGAVMTEQIVDMDVPEASVVDRIEATRFMSSPRLDNWLDSAAEEDKGKYIPYALPDHYVVQYGLFLGSGDAQDNVGEIKHYKSILHSTLLTTVSDTIPYELSQIDWHPLIQMIDGTKEGEIQVSTFGDLNYWTKLSYPWFERVNDLAFQALFTLR